MERLGTAQMELPTVCRLAHVNSLFNKIEVRGSLCIQALMQQDAAYFSPNNP